MIEGKEIDLRPASSDDAEYLFGLRNNLDLQGKLLARPKPNTINDVKKWYQIKTEMPDSVFFVICEHKDKLPLGFIQLTNIDYVSRTSSLGICLDQGSRGKGVGHEAITMLEQYAIKTYGLRKVVLEVIAENKPALKLYDTLGYHQAGVFSQHYYFDSKFHDVIIMEKFI